MTTTPAQRRGAPQGLPAADPDGARPPDRLPRLGLVGPATARGHRRHGAATTRPRTPTCTAASTPPPRSRRTSTSRPASSSAASSARPPRPTRSSSPRTRPSRSTWSRTPGPGANLKAGDRILLTEMEHHANIVPWLMLAEEVGLELRYIPVDGEGRLDLSDLATLDGRREAGGRLRHVQRARHHQSRRRDRRRGPQRRGARPGRRGAVGAPRPDRRDGPRGRLPRLLRPQDDGADRDRRAVGPPRAARRHAAVPRRRRHDPRREARLLPPRTPARAFRGGHAADRRGGRALDRGRLPERHRHGPHPGPRARAHQLRPGPPGREARAATAGSSARRPARTGAA